MNREKKMALKYGVDENCERLEYYCPKCGNLISLAARRCPICRNKRPDNAYELALSTRQELEAAKAEPKNVPVPGTVCKRPLPKPLCYAQTTVPAGCYIEPAPCVSHSYASPDFERMNIPKFYSTDEYGRVFEMPVSYKPLGVGGPVPVPIPSQTVQTSPIDIPVNFKV